jgi:hypothetical protein
MIKELNELINGKKVLYSLVGISLIFISACGLDIYNSFTEGNESIPYKHFDYVNDDCVDKYPQGDSYYLSKEYQEDKEECMNG